MHKKLAPVLALITLLAAALVGCSGGGSADPSPLASLSEAVGDVSVSDHGGGWNGADIGMSLDAGDGIRTGNNSTAEITFLDGSTIELEADTEIDIVALEISSDTGPKTVTLDQIIGDTISRVTHLVDSESSYEIETASGTAAVRGTIMLVHVGEDGTTLVTNQEGDIYVTAQGVELDIPVGQTAVIVSGEPPELAPLAGDDAWSTNEDTPRIVLAPGLLANDSDPDAGDTLSVISLDTSETVGNVTAWNPAGAFRYDPNGRFEYLGIDDWTTDRFTYTVSDGRGGTDTGNVTMLINGANDAPVAEDDEATTLMHTRILIPVLENDTDADLGDTNVVSAVTQAAHGQVFNNGDSVTYAPDFDFRYGIDTFTYQVVDGSGGKDTATVTVHVNTTQLIEDITITVGEDGPTGNICVWDTVSDWYAIDENNGYEVDGTHHRTPSTIGLLAGRNYYVWVMGTGGYYDVAGLPDDWETTVSPVEEGYPAAYGYLTIGHPVYLSFDFVPIMPG